MRAHKSSFRVVLNRVLIIEEKRLELCKIWLVICLGFDVRVENSIILVGLCGFQAKVVAVGFCGCGCGFLWCTVVAIRSGRL